MPQLPPTRKAIVVTHFANTPAINVQEIAMPQLAAGHVLVKVAAASLNPVDIATAQGLIVGGPVYPTLKPSFPMVLGWDVAGVIEEVGPHVTQWQRGDRIIAMLHQPALGYGTQSEYVMVPAELLVSRPEQVAAVEAAALPLAGLTAHQAITALRLHRGETVLINAPLGAVGRFAVQLARLAGAEVVGVVRDVDRTTAQVIGVNHMIVRGDDWRSTLPRSLTIDAALDLVGGSTAEETLTLVRNNGRFATVIPHIGSGLQAPQRGVVRQSILIVPDTRALADLTGLLATQKLTVAVAKTYAIEQAAEAYAAMTRPHRTGKIIIKF